MASSQQLVHPARNGRPRRPVRKPLHDNEYLAEGLDQLKGANPQVPSLPSPSYHRRRTAAAAHALVITDDGRRSALRSTRNRLRTVRQGAADRRSRARQRSKTDDPAMEHRELLQVVRGSGGGLESGADLRRDQLDLLGRERLPDHPQGWAEGASVKDRDAVDQQLAQPGQPGDMD